MLRLDQQIKLGLSMINNLRFMAVDGLEYLIIADQVTPRHSDYDIGSTSSAVSLWSLLM